MKHTARDLVVQILCEWEKSKEPVDGIRDQWLEKNPFLDSRDRHLIMALLYGVLRRKAYLDRVLEKMSSHPLKKMKARTLNALRVGLFQLFFLDRIPPSAAINETVKTLKKGGEPRWVTGFANGLLRNIVRRIEDGSSPWDKEPMPDHVLAGHPEWIFQRWKSRFGRDEAFRLCDSNNQEPPLTLRVNRSRISVEKYIALAAESGFEARTGGFAPEAVIIQGNKGSVSDLPGYAEGLFLVQDEAAQLIVPLFGARENGTYLDACAGLGGKTVQLAQLISDESRVIAVEPSSARRELLNENLNRFGLLHRVDVRAFRLQDFARERGSDYMGILVDAPCSGLGVIRRHPDIRWNRNPEDLDRFSRSQLELLEAASSILAPDGVLVYSTCSTETEENQQVIERFLERHGDFEISDCKPFLPVPARIFADGNGFFQTLPGSLGVDGFFAARLKKTSIENHS